MRLSITGRRIGLISLVFACGAISWMLIGAASAPDSEMLMVQATPEIYYTDCRTSSAVSLLVAVCSPSRGPVVNLKRGNLVVEEAIIGVLGDDPDDCSRPVMTDFDNIGDGFYVVRLEPGPNDYCTERDYDSWWYQQYALRIKVTCPWGVGIAVTSLNMIMPCAGSWWQYYDRPGI